ncbi:MAG TPA: IPT/TIG domain-containing protein, partial [Bryobacteraceae bacterium]|nr:IPT/TIG domain-containing protein [Bryobacteraceae bacterium]
MLQSSLLTIIALGAALAPLGMAQQSPALSCTTRSQPPLVRFEGLAERVGDVVFDCAGGTPNGQVMLNFALFLNVNFANRIDAANHTDIAITADTGEGPVTMSAPAVLVNAREVTVDGVAVPFSSKGTVQIRIANIRGNASQVNPLQPFINVTASIGGSTVLAITNSTAEVAQAVTGLYSSEAGTVACNQAGSAPAATPSFGAFMAKGTSVDNVRVTEGFAYALAPKTDLQNLHADTGTRILVQYAGAPPNTVFYVPDVVAGSNATQATSAGAYGVPVSGGRYTPGGKNSLLLARVYGADANGAGGAPAYQPGAPGSGTVSFDKLGSVPTTADGTAFVVYEVMGAANNERESAQIPVFITFPPLADGLTYNVSEQASLAPVSAVAEAGRTAPIPRFSGAIAASDCPILGDCTVPTTPALRSVTSSANFSAGTVVAGSLATIMGANLKGGQVVVAFGGEPGTLLYNDANQINVRVPAEVPGPARTQVLVMVDGVRAYDVVTLKPFSPGV